MNPTIVFGTFQRHLTRPLSLVAILAYAFFGLLAGQAFCSSDLYDGLAVACGCFPLVWVLGTGLIGNDISNGSLSLLLARPVSRREYLFSRWLGLVGTVLFVHICVITLMTLLRVVSRTHGDFNLESFGISLLCAVLMTVASASLLTLFSTFLPGHGDTGVFLGIYILQAFLFTSLRDRSLEAAIMTGSTALLLPGALLLEDIKKGDPQVLRFVTAYLCAAALELWLAWRYLEQRDLSYVNR